MTIGTEYILCLLALSAPAPKVTVIDAKTVYSLPKVDKCKDLWQELKPIDSKVFELLKKELRKLNAPTLIVCRGAKPSSFITDMKDELIKQSSEQRNAKNNLGVRGDTWVGLYLGHSSSNPTIWVFKKAIIENGSMEIEIEKPDYPDGTAMVLDSVPYVYWVPIPNNESVETIRVKINGKSQLELKK